MKFTFGGNTKIRDAEGKALPMDWSATWAGWLVAIIIFIRVIARDFRPDQAIIFLSMVAAVLLALIFVFLKKIIRKKEWDWCYPMGAFLMLYMVKDEVASVYSTYL